MDRSAAFGSTTTPGTSSTNTNAKVESAAMAAHQATDRIADSATTKVDQLSGTAHRAVNRTADAVASATDWASTIPEQAKQVQARFTESACTAIRAKPLQTVAGTLIVGYLLGRLARLWSAPFKQRRRRTRRFAFDIRSGDTRIRAVGLYCNRSVAMHFDRGQHEFQQACPVRVRGRGRCVSRPVATHRRASTGARRSSQRARSGASSQVGRRNG